MGRLTIEQAIEYWKIFLDEIEELKDTPGTDPEEWDKQEKATVAALEALVKQRHYEDMEEAGRLITLPCAVGDTVWQITRNFISEFKIKSFICDNEGIFFYWECINGIYINILGFSDNRIGKDVFLTKEEAEAKLRELGVS